MISGNSVVLRFDVDVVLSAITRAKLRIVTPRFITEKKEESQFLCVCWAS